MGRRRFKKELDPQAAIFNASISFDYVLYPYDIAGSIAHTKMLEKQLLISKNDAKKIINGLKEIKSELDQNKHPFKIEYEDIHMMIEQLLIQKIGAVGKKLHTARSRNDQVALDIRLYAKDKGKEINDLLKKTIKTFSLLEKKHSKDTMPGYTHLQQAQPVTLGMHLQAYQNMFQRDLIRLKNWYKLMNFSPLGAGALAGTTLNIDRNFTAKELKFNGIIENSMDAVSDRDFVIELCSIISLIMMHCSRLSEDIIIWSTQEFNFVELDDAFATGSSLMPHKKNPDIPELIRGKSGRSFGNLITMLSIMKALPLTYNKDMQEDKEALFDSVTTVIHSLTILNPFLTSLTFNTKKMSDAANDNFLNAVKIMETLIKKGMSLRDAHHQVGQWVADAIQKNKTIDEIIGNNN
jgi:argininosuccinate lyase